MSFAQDRFNEMLTNRKPNILYSGFSYYRETTAALGAIVFRREVVQEGEEPRGVDIIKAEVDKADSIKVYEDVLGARVVDDIGPGGTAQVVIPGGTTAPFFDETRIVLYNGLAFIPNPNPPSGLPPIAEPGKNI